MSKRKVAQRLTLEIDASHSFVCIGGSQDGWQGYGATVRLGGKAVCNAVEMAPPRSRPKFTALKMMVEKSRKALEADDAK